MEPKLTIPVHVMNSRLYLSEGHAAQLFGSGYHMQIAHPRPGRKGQFVYQETVRAVGPGGSINRMQICGPFWEKTTVELTPDDAKLLGVDAPVRKAGDIRFSANLMLQGPFGVLELIEGVLIPQASLYGSPSDAERWGFVQGTEAKLALTTDPSQTVSDVFVRIHPTYSALLEVVPGTFSTTGATLSAQLVTSST